MSEYIIYHNPRCSKSRQTLSLLQDAGITPMIVEYLKHPPSLATLKTLLAQLNLPASKLIRHKETEYKTLNLNGASETVLLKAMHQHPNLIERPIVIKGQQAVIGRPPENINSLLD